MRNPRICTIITFDEKTKARFWLNVNTVQEGIELLDEVLTKKNGMVKGDNGFVNLNKAMYFLVKEESCSEQEQIITYSL